MNKGFRVLILIGLCLSVIFLTSCQYVTIKKGETMDSYETTANEEKSVNAMTTTKSVDGDVETAVMTTAEKATETTKEASSSNDLLTETGVKSLEALKELLEVINYNFEEGVVVDVTNPSDYYVLANKKNALPSDYAPNDLVIGEFRYSFDGEHEKKYMRKVAADALKALFDGAEAEGLFLFAVSGYRSYGLQERIFNYNVNTYGEESANQFSARPGQSEHQTGLAMDISSQSAGFALEVVFGDTEEGQWVKDHAHLYGFIIRYPKDKVDITGYQYEPWHLRYIGEDIATYLYENGLCLEEFYEQIREEN